MGAAQIRSACAILAVLSGCSAPAQQPQAAAGATAIECALGEGSSFGRDCLVERSIVGEQRLLIVRHPDGGFRRFEEVDDGRGLVEMDGADEVSRRLDGDTLVIAIGADRYRFTANVRGADGSAE